MALDLVNSIDPREGPEERIDYLSDYEAIARWAVHASVISEARRDELLALAASSPRDARAVWRRVVRLREALFRIVRALARNESPARSDLAVIDGERRRADRRTALLAKRRDLDESGAAFEIVMSESAELDAPLRMLVRAAVELLTQADPTRLGECPAEDGGCGWIILDTTRNRSRRWCDMRVCGNRAKAARLTDRRREARASGSPKGAVAGGSR
jgi:predicted RNA-binding Zn ribbon-like protein